MEEDSWEGAGKHETELEQSREQGTRSDRVAEYRRRPVLRQELKGKEEEEENKCNAVSETWVCEIISEICNSMI